MKRCGRLRRRGQDGQALVELALVLPILMALLLGIFTGGSAYSRKVAIVDAVREGARFGTTLSLGTPPEAAPYTAFVAKVKQRVVDVAGGALQLSDVCVELDDPAAPATTPCGVADPASAGPELMVKVSASRPAKIEAFLLSFDVTLRGSAVGRYERAT